MQKKLPQRLFKRLPGRSLLTAMFVAVLTVMLLQPVSAAPQAVTDGFKRMFPETSITSVREVVTGIYEIVSRGEIIYITADGKSLLVGSIWDTTQVRDLTEDRRKSLRRKALAELGDDRMVVYAPQDYQYTVNVFTDVDCTYCRKFHGHMSELKKLGVRVNYLLTPFRGEQAHARAIGVWCAKDRNAAMDRAKKGKDIPLRECDNPIDEHLRLSQLFGVRGTPAIVLENGTFISGYVPPQELLKALKRGASQSSS